MPLQLSLIFIAGVLISTSIFYLILYFGFGRRKALLFLSICCLCQAGKAIFRKDGGLAVDLLGLSVVECSWGMFVVYQLGSFCLLAFLLLQLKIPKSTNWLIGIAMLIGIVYVLDWPLLPFVLVLGIGISLLAYRRAKLAAAVGIIGLICFGVASYLEQREMSPTGYFIGIILFMILVAVLVGYEIKQQILQGKEMLIRSTRLENQLLKKSLQPHFLFNSLMSLQEWIERSPQKAAQFVQDLAKEFRLVSKLSGQKLIPITEELEMCRAHLAIMGYRRNASFCLETKGIVGDEKVPPAIFHTIVENGITHGFSNRRKGIFILTKSETENHLSYSVENDGNSNSKSNFNGTGTGLKYITSRLEESYPNRWHLEEKPLENGWSIRVDIKK